MKRSIKAVSIFLLIATLMSATSCTGREEEYDDSIRVEIVRDDIVYSEEYIKNVNDRFTKVVIPLVEELVGVTLNDGHKRELAAQFRLNVIPMMYRIRIYEEELDRVLSSLEEYSAKDKRTSLLHAIYTSAIYTLGKERAGKLTFGVSGLILTRRAEGERENYERYGSSRYLKEAERLEAMAAQLAEMGEDRFSEAMSIFTAIASAATTPSIGDGEADGFILGYSDLIYVLEYRAEQFRRSGVTEDEWSLLGSLFAELIPKRTDTPEAHMLYELKKTVYPSVGGEATVSYFTTAARVMPAVTELYSALAKELKYIDPAALYADADTQALALAGALVGCEDELSVLSVALITYAKTDTENQRSVVAARYDGESIAQFKATYAPLSYGEYLDALTELSERESAEGAAERLGHITLSYLISIAPEVAAVFSGELSPMA